MSDVELPTDSAPKDTHGLDAWIARMSEEEMPSVTATASKLEHLARQDTSTLGQIGQAVLHDPALTTQILRVANSAIYNPAGREITTVSRAAVILGFKTIRGICITSKLLDSLLNDGDLSAPVYDRLLKLLAGSFHAAVQARGLVGEADEDTLEEVFIAALLSDLGASAFWGMGGAETEALDARLRDSDETSDSVVDSFLGTSFNDISVGLARSWKLGTMLLESLQDGGGNSKELRSVRLARELSEAVADEGWPGDRTAELIEQAAVVMSVTPQEALKRVRENSRQAGKLASCYGAVALGEHLSKTVAAVSGKAGEQKSASVFMQADESLQLRVLRELTAMMGEKPDFNLVIHTAMEGIHRGIGMDRSITGLLGPDRSSVTARFVLGEDSDAWSKKFHFVLNKDTNLFVHALQSNAPVWFDPKHAVQTRRYLTEDLQRFCGGRGCLLAPVTVARRPVGFLYADRRPSAREITEEDFSAFAHFAQQVSLCLSNISRRDG